MAIIRSDERVECHHSSERAANLGSHVFVVPSALLQYVVDEVDGVEISLLWAAGLHFLFNIRDVHPNASGHQFETVCQLLFSVFKEVARHESDVVGSSGVESNESPFGNVERERRAYL